MKIMCNILHYMIWKAVEIVNGGETIYLSGELKHKAFVSTKHNTEYLPLQSNQEEADTQNILHAVAASIHCAYKSF